MLLFEENVPSGISGMRCLHFNNNLLIVQTFTQKKDKTNLLVLLLFWGFEWLAGKFT